MKIENKLPGERQGVDPPSAINRGDVKFHHRGHREHRGKFQRESEGN